MTEWRTTTGSWINWPDGDPDWVWTDDMFDDWRVAQLALINELQSFTMEMRGQCEHCYEQGRSAMNSLAERDVGDEWHDEVDGHDYCLTRFSE